MRLYSLLWVTNVEFTGVAAYEGLSKAVIRANGMQLIGLFVLKLLVDRNEVTQLQMTIEKIDKMSPAELHKVNVEQQA